MEELVKFFNELTQGKTEVFGLPIPNLVFLFGACLLVVIIIALIVAAVISNKYRKKHKLGKYAPDTPAKTPTDRLKESAVLPHGEYLEAIPASPKHEVISSIATAVGREDELWLELEEEPVAPAAPRATPAPEVAPAPAPSAVAEPALELVPEEETSIAAATVFGEDERESAMLSGMMDESAKEALSSFDFEGDFEEWVEPVPEVETPVEEPVIAPEGAYDASSLAAAYAIDLSDVEDEEEDEEEEEEDEEVVLPTLVDAERGFAPTKYSRSFRSRLMQSTPEVKGYYSIIKNELLSYAKMRNAEAWAGESFALGRRTYARMAFSGKTLAVYLALKPDEFNPDVYHHRDKGATKKYASTPLMMRVRSSLGLRRTLSLIVAMASDNSFVKNAAYEPVDFRAALPYRTDEQLLDAQLIKVNLSVTSTVEAEVKAAEPSYRQIGLVKKGQIGRITERDMGRINNPKPSDLSASERKRIVHGAKFVVESFGGSYRFLLTVSGDKVLYTSSLYKTQAGAIKAVDTFKNALKKDTEPTFHSTEEGQIFYVFRGSRSYTSPMYDTAQQAADAYEQVKLASDVALIEVV